MVGFVVLGFEWPRGHRREEEKRTGRRANQEKRTIKKKRRREDNTGNMKEIAIKTKEVYFKVKNVRKTAEQMGFSYSKTRKLLTNSGVIFSKKHEEILTLYNQGKSLREITKITGLSVSTVDEYLPYEEDIEIEKLSLKTKQNRAAKMRKKALENKDDVKGILRAYNGCRGFDYCFEEDGVVLEGVKYPFESPEARKMVEMIIEKKTRK